ncbi:hypothetical protein [Lysinibacillus irui]|uniref:Uncharacterized protein n=1 Tax=Lysinibacillus irui TaxID=2998077 RepID=A0AAJ5RR99_9BACI|nr:hypothetical protein [Lysinibacillus irui]WDV06154.1 hypothetical protein OU989_18110 [Lysinibacillus irui]
MIDTVKFDIPLKLTDDEINNANWSRNNKTKYVDNGETFVSFKHYDNEYIGCPRIKYVCKKSDPNYFKLSVEVSLPKLRYGTNFYEVDDNELIFTLGLLKMYISRQLSVVISRMPPVDSWKVTKLHICKNLNVGAKVNAYLKAASNTTLRQHKLNVYMKKGGNQVQSVIWQAKTRKEKLYDKKEEVLENNSMHENYEKLIPFLNGVIRYEVELNNNEIRKLQGTKNTTELLSSATILPVLNRYLRRLGITNSYQTTELAQTIEYIEKLNISTNSKSSLIAFATRKSLLGTNAKEAYSESGFKKIKSQFSNLIESELEIVKDASIPDLVVSEFDFTKFKNGKRRFQCYN